MAQRTCSVEGCDRTGSFTRGWCSMHYARWQRHGDPLHVRRARRSPRHLRELLAAAAVADTDECIIFPRPNGNRPIITFGGRVMAASRVAWILAHGDPGELWVLHRCNGGSGANGCVNPRHLYLGDAWDNAQDRW